MNGEKKELVKEKDLMKAIRQVTERWKFVLTMTVCFGVLGVIIAFSTVKTYTVDVVVAPESSSSSTASSGLSSLSSMVGLDLGVSSGEEALYPTLYPDIAKSLPFLTGLLDVRVKTLDGSVDTTYFAYKQKFEKRSWLDYVKGAPSKFAGVMKSVFSSKGPDSANAPLDSYRLSESQMKFVENLKGIFDVFVDKKTNVVTISFSDRDPLVAATMANTITDRLQKAVTEYRTKKAMDYCLYVEKMYLEARDSLEVSQKRYADFVDRNRNVTSEHVLIEKERLVADKELKASLSTYWAQLLQQAKAKIQENTPVFVTLQPAAVPALPSSMGRMTKTLLFAIFGSFVAVAYIFVSKYFKRAGKQSLEEDKK